MGTREERRERGKEKGEKRGKQKHEEAGTQDQNICQKGKRIKKERKDENKN